MRITLHLLGWTFDSSLEPTAAEDAGPADLGATGGTWLGFTPRHETPEEVPCQPHTPAWDEPEERA